MTRRANSVEGRANPNASDLRRLLERYQSLEVEFVALQGDLSAASSDKWDRLLPPSTNWAVLYELTYPEHLTLFLRSIGIFDDLTRLVKEAKGKSRISELLRAVENGELDRDDLPTGVSVDIVFVSLVSLMLTLTSWMVYARTLSGLVKDVRDGNKRSFFRAVRVDKTILCAPSVAHFMSKAMLREKPSFFKKLSNVMRTGRQRPRSEHEPLRFVLTALAEDGQLEGLSGNARYRLFCEELDVYSEADKRDPAEGLRMFISRWQKTVELYRTQTD